MRARLIVFPIKGRNWCFSRSIDTSVSELGYSRTSPTLKDLCKEISSNGKSMNENAELVVDFVSDKMNRAWIGLEKAPEGTFKKKIYGLGLHLLARVKPSEIFLKSISKEVTEVEVTFPKSLNSRLVRRRLRHTALRLFVGRCSLERLTPVMCYRKEGRLLASFLMCFFCKASGEQLFTENTSMVQFHCFHSQWPSLFCPCLTFRSFGSYSVPTLIGVL
ncbi:PREDICTED: uncharacterized protein LOC104590427 isoform X3 [Nelumbo nucifera]|uniref:Uncharacterized protein LOC104590427 isoform X3 n=1 Tax=Nelumbo nucifera TaxID=4432 RepID=A0A1U7Z8Q0_NELNU|nr:PREDICTED: uncharacterized protein LOC104590427 isoform X3 [Nelumbo nucifera]XP_010247399.1 PREDICTED: uncharacterized protein LOC104590427 isoform X3 [Nelumbo nucifera]